MGSTFTTFSGQKVKGFNGKEYSLPVYLQFIPGYCAEVVHSAESLGYKGNKTINSIYAVSHVPNKIGKRRQQSYSEENRYFPLLRNHGDVPTKGDPVLLCTIGKINYYLGPLNTINNSPTWNDDLNYKKELTMPNEDLGQNTPRGERGESLNFNKEVLYDRLEKIRNKDLDYGKIINEVTGDYMIEGRHGNSIRVGSRSNNPYIFISNDRGSANYSETLGDGSLITITSNGTLANHFPNYVKGALEFEESSNDRVFGFTLASDTFQEPNRFMGTLISNVNNNQDAQELIYNYNGNQMLLNSDRITLNSKLDDIYLSSIKDIHIGTGRHLTISTNEDFVINSQRIILGNPETATEPMVLGTTLLELLKETLAVIKSSQGICQGAPIPLADDTGSPGGVNAKITQIEQKIDQILSTKHFIEPNT